MSFNNQLWRWFLNTVILILVCWTLSARGIRRQNVYAKIYIEDQCTKNENISYLLHTSGMSSGLKIEASRNRRFSPNRNCTITITPPLGRSIFLKVESFYFGSYYGSTNNCSEYLEIFGKFGNSTKLCGYHGETLGFTTRGRMTLRYHTNMDRLGTGFSLVATVFRGSEYHWCDQEDFFVCDNSRCIWHGFTCDGINNCEDNSDEKNSSPFSICADVEHFTLKPINTDWDTFYPTSNFPSFRESTNITVGTAVCSIFILIFAVAVRFYCYYQCAQIRRRTIESRIAVIRTRAAFMPSPTAISGSAPPPYTSLVNDPDGRSENPPEYSSCVNPTEPNSETSMESHDPGEKQKHGNDVAQPHDFPPPYAP